MKLNIAGDIQWQHALGGSGKDYGKSIQQTNDGGYILAGYTQSTNGDVLDNDGGQDFWLIKLNFEGEIQWQQTLGGTKAERLDCIQQTSDDGYIIAGYTWSSDGDASGLIQGYFDFWVIKLSSESVGVEDVTIFNPDQHLDMYPNPANQSISIKAASEEPSLTICISDLLGRQISQQTIPNGGQADIALLPKGLYLVVATTPSGKVFSNKISKV